MKILLQLILLLVAVYSCRSTQSNNVQGNDTNDGGSWEEIEKIEVTPDYVFSRTEKRSVKNSFADEVELAIALLEYLYTYQDIQTFKDPEGAPTEIPLKLLKSQAKKILETKPSSVEYSRLRVVAHFDKALYHNIVYRNNFPSAGMITINGGLYISRGKELTFDVSSSLVLHELLVLGGYGGELERHQYHYSSQLKSYFKKFVTQESITESQDLFFPLCERNPAKAIQDWLFFEYLAQQTDGGRFKITSYRKFGYTHGRLFLDEACNELVEKCFAHLDKLGINSSDYESNQRNCAKIF